MPATPAQLVQDLESLLERALSRSQRGAWQASLETINRAAQILPPLLAQLGPHDTSLRRCQDLLGQLRERFVLAQERTREELDQLRYARNRLRPTRNAYTDAAAAHANRRCSLSA
ncbi:hypothetical protein [Actomonas aquatica]|uniref:Flagellar protein FliT n=1 Tax=Actomonas aquatica TaxID=2866162 RepID=A0ABZ1CCQ4_9BACT|nr:hypothetical protein [Opitutus sp. WL0086]WRQ89329.1 hypothetical protein K1X11_007905 [Opitutus sp. WL0086]